MLASCVKLATRPVPLSSIPPMLVRLPPTASTSQRTDDGNSGSSTVSTSSNKSHSPTIDRLLKSFAQGSMRRPNRLRNLSADGRGLANATNMMMMDDRVPGDVHNQATTPQQASQDSKFAEAAEQLLPPNLRIEEFVPKRKEYTGVKSSHRSLVSPRATTLARPVRSCG